MKDTAVHLLVSEWRTLPNPPYLQITAWRERLFTAAIADLKTCIQKRTPYNPMDDACFCWANAWLDHAENPHRPINEDLDFLVGMILNPPPPISRQHLAAADYS